ncbi:MAG TPA: hypothetical protein VIV11_16185 [Kofleriaceae bacterium]
MTSSSPSKSPEIRVRQRVPWLSLAGILLVVTFTLGSAAANMLPHHIPTKHELQRAEQNALIAERKLRIATLLAEGDRCRIEVARELARALVFDGRYAVPYADDYERRCGEDPIVRRWANASYRWVRIAKRY